MADAASSEKPDAFDELSMLFETLGDDVSASMKALEVTDDQYSRRTMIRAAFALV